MGLMKSGLPAGWPTGFPTAINREDGDGTGGEAPFMAWDKEGNSHSSRRAALAAAIRSVVLMPPLIGTEESLGYTAGVPSPPLGHLLPSDGRGMGGGA